MTAKTVRLKGPKDLTALVISKINAGRPKNVDGRAPDVNFEVTRSSVEILSKVKYVLSTGIDSIDAATGIGGLPFGRITEIYGLDGSGKSALALRCAVRMQEYHVYERVKPTVEEPVPTLKQIDTSAKKTQVFTLFIDNEQSIDEDGKTTVGGTQLDCAVARCDTVDQMFKIIESAIDCVQTVTHEQNKKRKDSEPEVECYVLVVVDTIAGTSSREEMAAKWEAVDYTRQPKQLREGFRCIVRKLARCNVCVICTNQVSDSYTKNKSYGNSNIPQDGDFNTFGGRALKFYASMRIFMFKLNTGYKLNPKLQFPSGLTVGFQFTKNRLGKPWRTGRAVILYDGGLSNTYSRLETIIHLKLAERVEGDKGAVTFKFTAAGIAPTTFPELAEERSKNPRLPSLAEWPAFYQAHQADFDQVWARGQEIMFNDGVSKDDDDDESVDAPATTRAATSDVDAEE